MSPPEGADESGASQGYAAPTANDEDLGIQAILRRQQRYRPFSVSVSAPFYFTSNVALSPNNEKSDVVFTPGLSVVYQPHLTQTLYLAAGVAQQFFFYSQYDSLNFSSFDANIGLNYYLPRFHDLSLGLHYDYNRLTNDDWDKLFSNHQLLLTAELPFRLGRAMGLSLGTGINFSLAADPDSPRRDEYDFHLGYHVQFSRSFSIDAVARIVLKEFEENRTDVSEILALSASYRMRDWLSFGAATTFAWNQSSESEFDYQVANLGASIAVTVRF